MGHFLAYPIVFTLVMERVDHLLPRPGVSIIGPKELAELVVGSRLSQLADPQG
jgi:hypothetical protein